MIVAEGLTKSFGGTVAVNDVSFEVQPGTLVALVGHDGAGKTTTLRMLVGHITPTSGSCTILDKPFRELEQPLRHVGVLLGSGLHPARTARDHLRICAALGDLPASSVDDALRLVGLEAEAGDRTGRLSADKRQRLSIATALLADPEVVILDEPSAGLDAEGLGWLRSLLRSLADANRVVLVASQEPDDIDETADRVLVLDRGKLLKESAPRTLTGAEREVLVRSPGAEVLAEELRDAGIAPSAVSADEVRVRDVPVQVVSEMAQSSGVPVWEIREDEPSLEEAVVELTSGGSSNGGSPGDGERAKPAEASDERDAPAPEPRDEAEAALDAELSDLADPEQANIVAVLAPADGLGRTTVAFLLADALAASADLSTLAVALSCDHERMSIPVASDRRTTLCLDDLMGDLPGFDESAHISPYVSVARSGAHALCGAAQRDDLRALEPPQIEELLDFAGRFYPLVVLDVGELSEPSLRAVVRRADQVLLLGAPGAVDDLDERCDVLDAIEAERTDPATLVFNLVDAERVQAVAEDDGPRSHVLVPEDRELIRALDAGDFDLAAAAPVTRTALKRLALAVAEDLR